MRPHAEAQSAAPCAAGRRGAVNPHTKHRSNQRAFSFGGDRICVLCVGGKEQRGIDVVVAGWWGDDITDDRLAPARRT
ncbi:hypothetical protein [Oryza sativa Japonica Group]|uniref:Uncharacterized protein n=1 Tax=Oryza sativa subsp. japonica TaxID=39947 RepID=Q5N8W3_ORYSJ|nr:hypothetical protein [Oryza sativa Japonica Group]